MSEGRLDRARERSANARRRLTDTIDRLQGRLDPRALAKEAVEGLAEGGREALTSGVEAAKRNPFKLAGAAALLAAFLGRRPLASLLKKPRSDEPAKPARPPRVRSTKARPSPAKRISK